MQRPYIVAGFFVFLLFDLSAGIRPVGAGIITGGDFVLDVFNDGQPQAVIPFSVSSTRFSAELVSPGGNVHVVANNQRVAARWDAGTFLSGGQFSDFANARYYITADVGDQLLARGNTLGSFGNGMLISLERWNSAGAEWKLVDVQGTNSGPRDVVYSLDAGADYRLSLGAQGDAAGGLLGDYNGRSGWLWGLNSLPGSDSTNPLLPEVSGTGDFVFDDIPVVAGVIQMIDPVVATGFDYVALDSLFQSVLVPDALPNGDSEFQLVAGGSTFQLSAGSTFDLTTINPLGLSSFSITGIDTSELLDPTNPTAFVTGVGFVDSGLANFTMTPIVTNTDSSVVPEPSSMAIFVMNAVLLTGIGRRRPSRS